MVRLGSLQIILSQWWIFIRVLHGKASALPQNDSPRFKVIMLMEKLLVFYLVTQHDQFLNEISNKGANLPRSAKIIF